MRVFLRAAISATCLAATTLTLTPAPASASVAPGGVLTLAPPAAAFAARTVASSGRDGCLRNYSGRKYCHGERPYHGWSRYHEPDYDYGYDYDYDDYDDGYYGGYGHYEEFPLVCGPSRYSCRAPRRP